MEGSPSGSALSPAGRRQAGRQRQGTVSRHLLEGALSTGTWATNLFVLFQHELVPAVQHLQPLGLPLPQHRNGDILSATGTQELMASLVTDSPCDRVALLHSVPARLFLVRTPESLTAGKSVLILAKEQENRKLSGSFPLIHFPRSGKKKKNAESHFTTDETCHVDMNALSFPDRSKTRRKELTGGARGLPTVHSNEIQQRNVTINNSNKYVNKMKNNNNITTLTELLQIKT